MAMNWFVKNGRVHFGWTGPTEISKNTSRGDPEYFGRKEPKRIFPFDLRPNFPEALA